ncbi:MAG TPA: redoxin family protein [Burkholderiales bacterium]|nr:redoxin family protein [Burkholderiales bacterium]
MSDAAVRTATKSKASLWLIAAVCIAPVLASYLAYYFWQPEGHVNYGELLEPKPMPDPQLTLVDGTPFRLSQLRNHWVLLVAQPGACDASCQQQLIYLRQLRLAQGKESDRVERVWLVTDNAVPDKRLLEQFPGMYTVRAAGTGLIAALPAGGTPADHIYVVDVLGNMMMRYPRDADPRKMLKDIARLLRHSKWTT